MTDDLVVWLRVQLDEDERLARTCPTFGWVAPDYDEGGDDDTGHVADAKGRIVVWDAPARISAHIARWEPTRVLREVEAKRRILDLADSAAQHEVQNADDPVSRLEKALAKVTVPAFSRVLRLLALPYSDRPGYRQEWAP